MTREQLWDSIREKQRQINSLHEEITELYRQTLLLCDEKQRFEEKEEVFIVRENRKKVSKKHLMGRIYWNEDFKDGDTGEIITIQRSQLVRKDGEWL
jgi:hypothetical protein